MTATRTPYRVTLAGGGAGPGSSSCYLAGLLNAVRAYLQRPVSPRELAEEACHIELEIPKKPAGRQDQHMAEFVANTRLYCTNVRRDATGILREQSEAPRQPPKEENRSNEVEDSLLRIRDIGHRIGEAVRELMQFMESQGMFRLAYNPEMEGSPVIANVLKSHAADYHPRTLLRQLEDE
jgi:galactokinase/mevalonate kinase-like predicted kinase